MFFLEELNFFGRVVVVLVVHGAVVGVLEVDVDEFEDAFWEDEDGVGGEVDVLVLLGGGVEAALEDAEEFDFFEVLAFAVAGFDFVDEFDLGVLVDGVNFEEVGADAVVFFGPDLH